MKKTNHKPYKQCILFNKKNKANASLSAKAVGFIAVLSVVAHLGAARNDTDGYRAFEEKQSAAKQQMYVYAVPDKEYGSFITTQVLKTEKTAAVMTSYSDADIELISKVISGVPSVLESDTKMAAIAWMILNRVDSPDYADTVEEVVSEAEFVGYKENNPFYEHVEKIAVDVLIRWNDSKAGFESERVLPVEYIDFFVTNNRVTIIDSSGKEWDWSLDSPYDT